MTQASTTHLQQLLDHLQAGDPGARDTLIEHSIERFRQLARRMFRRGDRLRQLDETDDVLQKALWRLHGALETVKPPDVRSYCGLAARQIRWVLADLARQAAGEKLVYGLGAKDSEKHFSPDEPEDPAGEPADLLGWAEFHAKIDALPEEEREVFDMLLYQGISQPEASELLGIPLRTLKRRWRDAKMTLHQALRGEWPSLEGGSQ